MCVLGQQTSHLLLIRTNLGYGTALTAACSRQGCSASDLVCFRFSLCNFQNVLVFFLSQKLLPPWTYYCPEIIFFQYKLP
jgi:hypothetical protein